MKTWCNLSTREYFDYIRFLFSLNDNYSAWWLSEPHALCSLSEGLGPHEPLSEPRLEGLLLVLWKVPLLQQLVQRLRLWSLFPLKQSLWGKRRRSWSVSFKASAPSYLIMTPLFTLDKMLKTAGTLQEHADLHESWCVGLRLHWAFITRLHSSGLCSECLETPTLDPY